MKTIFSIIIALLLFDFVVGNKAVANCPPGWVEHQVQLSDFCPICDATFTLCIWCYVSSPTVEFSVMSVDFNPPCNIYDIIPYFECITDVILNNYGYFCIYGWKPCNEGYQDVIIKWPLCWHYEILPNQQIILRRCDESWCVEHWMVCKNPDGSTNSYRILEGG